MSAAGSYPRRNVADERSAPPPPDSPRTAPLPRSWASLARPARPPESDATSVHEPEARVGDEALAAADGIDLSALSIAGITRRRVGWLAAALVSAWIVVVFARQAADASTAASRADEIARENAALLVEVDALEEELELISRPEYVAQQARGYRLGSPREIPFTLDPAVPAPGPNAPGSASVRLGADEKRVTPLESWLSLLFGPSD